MSGKIPQPWVQGMSSPNPTGINNPTPVDVREYARRHTVTAMREILKICLYGKKEASRLAAAKELLDRGWGKSTQSMQFETSESSGLLAVLGAAHSAALSQLETPMMMERVSGPEIDEILDYAHVPKEPDPE